MVICRKAAHEDVPQLAQIICDGVQLLRSSGVDQWQHGYPNAQAIQQDIQKGIAYLLEEDGCPVAYFALMFTPEESYRTIFDGQWLTGDNSGYATIHRTAVSASCRGRGLAGEMFRQAAAIAIKMEAKSMRVDTHPENMAMQNAIKKFGFAYCGKIRLIGGADDGKLRLAYEVLL